MLKQVPSRASFCGECASEFDTMAYRSSIDSRQFIGGSDDSPVSIVKIWGSISPKQASSVSNPELAPSAAKCGVQMCAGMNSTPSHASRHISTRSRLSNPRIGRPSDLRLPISSSRAFSRSTASKSGITITWCTLRVLSSFL